MDYTNWVNKALSMISKYGVDITISVITQGVYVPGTDSYPETTETYETKGLFTALEDTDEKGHVTKIENGMMLVPAKDLPRIDDQPKWTLTVGTKVYTSPKVETVEPGGTAILYKVRLI